MAFSHYAVFMVLNLGAVGANRINRAVASDNSSAQGTLCNLTESEEALGYGIKGAFPVKSCVQECKYLKFFTETFTQKVIQEPEVDETSCKCNYAPRYWEGAGSTKYWFQFRINPKNKCSKEGCKEIFYTWGNLFLKKMHYPGDNQRMPANELLERDNNYDLKCAQGVPEGIVLPSPNDKIAELRLAIARATDPDEKARLQALLDELLNDKEVEIFEYDLDGDWGPEHHADVSNGGDLHSYYLKPCKSNFKKEVTDLHEIMELCGPGEMGVSMKAGKLRWQYKPERDWGPELVCDIEPDKCQMLQEEVARDGWELLSFRLKPCMTPSDEKEVDPRDLSEILAEDHCGAPTLGVSLLPVKVSAAKKYDQDAPEDELEFPCQEDEK